MLLSLRLSCRSELTRQGASLRRVTCPWSVVRCPLRDRGTRSRTRAGHFCQPLHVAVQLGLYLHPFENGARRIVSEDSGSARCVRQGKPCHLQSRIRSFLLIACTSWIFTASRIARDSGRRVPEDTQAFQHLAESMNVGYPTMGSVKKLP